MQAIITKYLGVTATKPARIKATCSRGSKTTSIHSDKMIESIGSHDEQNHRIAAKALIDSFIAEDESGPHGLFGSSKWRQGWVTGQMANLDYVHVFVGHD